MTNQPETKTATRRTRKAAPASTPDAAAAADAAVLNGASHDTASPAKPATRKASTAPAALRTPATKPAASKAATGKPAPAKAATAKPAPAEPTGPSYRAYITKPVPSAMTGFTAWIAREFPEFGELDPRLVTVASKCYRHFQKSDLNR
jgi:hypothetical protein